MLRIFSRMERAHKWVLLFFAALMGLSLIVFYSPARNQVNATPTNTEVIAKVNGDEVTVGELTRLKESYQQMFGGQMNLAQLGGDRRMLDGLIRDRIIAQEAKRLGLSASDAEVAAEIRKQFPDAKPGSDALNRYKEIVTTRYGSVENYEQTVRDSIAAEKLRAFVTAGVSVSEQEGKGDFMRKGTTFDIAYVPVVADKLAARVQPSDGELQKYYDEHKTDFRYLEPQKKIRYLFIDQTKAGEKLNISAADLRAEYEQLPADKKLAGVKVQQIVLRVPAPEQDQQVLAKAAQIVSELRGGNPSAPVDEKKFADAARGRSEETATAKAGGWLPAPVKRNPNKPNELTQRTLDLQEGQITDPLFDKAAKSYFIFRRGPAVPKPFEDAKPELLVSLRNRRAYKVAAELAGRAAQRLKETKDVQKVADELAKEANMTPAEMVKETPLIKPGDDVPGIGSSQQFEDAIKPLEQAGDVGERTPIKNGFAIPLLVEKREPRIPDFAEVKDKLTERVKGEKAKAQLEQTARDIANAANKPDELKAAAEKYGLEVKTMEKYRLGQPLEQAGTSPVAGEAIYNLKEGEITKT